MNITILAALLAALGVTVALYFVFRVLRRASGSEQALLLLCHGSKEQKERLIALEQKRDPSRSRSQAIAAALYSLRRDKR